MARAVGDEAFDVVERPDAAAGTDCGAIEGRCRTSKLELARDGPVFEQRVYECGMEDVARAGGVCRVNVERGRVMEIDSVEGEDAIVAKGRGGKFVGKFSLDDLESLRKIGFAGDTAGDVHACDEEINVGEK